MSTQPRQSLVALEWVIAAAAALALAACGGSGATEQQASEPPAATTEKSPSASDPLEGEWRTEFTCRESVAAIERSLSAKQIHQQVGNWKAFLEGWGAEPTKKDPCHRATGTAALLVRFADGNLALCDAKTLQCDVNATYELVDKHSISVDDEEGNLCEDPHCPLAWRYEITGDKVIFHVDPEAFIVGTWEAAPWVRES